MSNREGRTGYAKGRNTRSEILASAMRVFSRKGFHSASLNDILQDVGITKGAFYHHWRCKEDLARDILSMIRKDYQELLANRLDESASAWEKIGSLLNLMSEMGQCPEWQHMGQLFLTFAADLKEGDERLAETFTIYVSEFRGTWVDLITEGQREGSVRKDLSPAALADLIVDSVFGVLIAQRAPAKGEPRPHLSATLCTLLRPTPTAARPKAEGGALGVR